MMADKIKIEWVPRHELTVAGYNPRKMQPSTLERLKKGIKEFGIVDPLIINRDGTVIGGHQRLQAAEECGFAEFPCVRLDLDAKREKALNLALNKLAGEWDYTKLSALLLEFEGEPGFDIELTGFDGLEAIEMSTLGNADLGGLGVAGGLPDASDLGSPIEGAGSTGDSKTKKTGLQYVIVFSDEGEQREWLDYLESLKERYPDEETVSARIIRDITER
jgi:hypothetical protein